MSRRRPTPLAARVIALALANTPCRLIKRDRVTNVCCIADLLLHLQLWSYRHVQTLPFWRATVRVIVRHWRLASCSSRAAQTRTRGAAVGGEHRASLHTYSVQAGIHGNALLTWIHRRAVLQCLRGGRRCTLHTAWCDSESNLPDSILVLQPYSRVQP